MKLMMLSFELIKSHQFNTMQYAKQIQCSMLLNIDFLTLAYSVQDLALCSVYHEKNLNMELLKSP